MSYDFTLQMCDGDRGKADLIWKASRDVVSYTQFKSVVDLGLNVGLSDIAFERAMIFSWIKEEIESGRKT